MTKTLHACLLTSARLFDIGYGGEGRFTASFARWLVGNGHEVTIMGSSFLSIKTLHISNRATTEHNTRSIAKVNEQKKIRAIYPPYGVYLLSRIVLSVLWIVKILILHARSPITLIHAQDTGYAGIAAVISGKLLRVPVVISSHGIRHKTLESVIQGRLRNSMLWFERRLDFLTVRNADNIIAINPAIKNYFSKFNIGKDIEVIPVPIRIRDFEFSQTNRDQMRREMGIEKNTTVIGFVGRFSAEKNLFTLLKAFANIIEKNSAIKLVLVGAGYLESQIRKFVKDRNIEDEVIFCGVRYDIGRILSSFDIFVLPSYAEGFGAALLEAMASGRASICSNIATFREWVTHKKEVLVVNPNEIGELEHAIELLLEDNILRSELGKNAKHLAGRYDEDVVFPKLLLYYEKCLRNKL